MSYSRIQLGENRATSARISEYGDYNVLHCESGTLLSFTPDAKIYGENVMGIILAMDVKPRQDVDAGATYKALATMRCRTTRSFYVDIVDGKAVLIRWWDKSEAVKITLLELATGSR